MKSNRIILRDGEIFKFDPKKSGFFEVYYNQEYKIPQNEFKFIVGHLAGFTPPKKLVITLIYLDTSKQCLPTEILEYSDRITVEPSQYKPGKNQHTTELIPITVGSKKLWKIRLEAEPVTKCHTILSFDLF